MVITIIQFYNMPINYIILGQLQRKEHQTCLSTYILDKNHYEIVKEIIMNIFDIFNHNYLVKALISI